MTQALKTDLYQLTMMQAYFSRNHNPYATFDYFVREIPLGSYLIVAGLPYVLSYAQNLCFDSDDLDYLAKQDLFTRDFLEYLGSFGFTGEIIGVPEGEIVFPKEPILRVRAPLMEAQLIESFILNKMNFSSLIATKASRVVYAAGEKFVAEFGLRRAHGEAQLEATRACFIGGCSATSNVHAGRKLGIPITGTMAHSFVVSFNKEIEAFRAYCETFPKSAILLIDTYDSLKGARKAAEIAGEMESEGHKLRAVRLDSGDLLKLSKEARNILDNAGCSYVKIFASSDLNEWKIQELLQNGAPIDAFGVGTEMVTAGANSALGGVYKLAEIEDAKGNSIPKLKLSDESKKATLPGKKTVWRLYDSKGMIKKDVIALEEEVKLSCPFRKIFIPLVQKGKIVYRMPSIKAVQDQVRKNLALLPVKYRGLDHAPEFPVSMSDGLEKLTHNCIHFLEQDSETSKPTFKGDR